MMESRSFGHPIVERLPFVGLFIQRRVSVGGTTSGSKRVVPFG
jgi:hypothetical protein